MGIGKKQFNAIYLCQNTTFLRILGPLCLASLGLEGLDQACLHLTLSRHIIFGFAPRKIKKNTDNFDQESWGQNQILCAVRESNVNELDPIPPGRVKRGKAALESSKMLCFHRGNLRLTAVYHNP